MRTNYKLLIQQLIYSFFKAKGTTAHLTPRRWVTLLTALLVFPIHHSITRICFVLDNVFFPGYRKQKVERPMFIIGNPRSGSTFMQRLVARDENQFTCMQTWEIYFAPTIIQRKVFHFLTKIDNLFGSPLQNMLGRWDERILGKTHIHKMGLWEPEEDEGIFIHIWGSYFGFVAFPIPELLPPYAYFDERLPEDEKARIMGYYRECVKRHLYYHGGDKIFFAKNPYFSGKVASVLEYFPDAEFVYLARNPLDVLPSTMTWWSFLWHVTSNPMQKYPFTDLVADEAKYRYTYTLERLEKLPPSQNLIVKYNDLVATPGRTIRDIYAHFGWKLDAQFARIVEIENERALNYESNNHYSLEDTGFDKQFVLTEFAEVFDRFGFDRREPEGEMELEAEAV